MFYFYPGNQKDSVTIAFCENGRVGSRTFQTSLGSKRDTLWLRKWLDGLTARGEWGVGMTHGISTGYDHFADAETLWAFLDDVAARQDSLWVAPFGEVSAYVRERDSIVLKVNQENDHVEIHPMLTLRPDIYHHPLTLVVTGLFIRSARQNGRMLQVYKKNGLQMIDFQPADGTVSLKVGISRPARTAGLRGPAASTSFWRNFICTFAMPLMILLVLNCSTKVSERSDMAKR